MRIACVKFSNSLLIEELTLSPMATATKISTKYEVDVKERLFLKTIVGQHKIPCMMTFTMQGILYQSGRLTNIFPKF